MSVPVAIYMGTIGNYPPMVTVLNQQILDLGLSRRIALNSDRASMDSHNFQGFVGAHEAVLTTSIEALNFVSSIFVVEISWDGIWDYVPATMRHHLTIELTSPSPTPSRGSYRFGGGRVREPVRV